MEHTKDCPVETGCTKGCPQGTHTCTCGAEKKEEMTFEEAVKIVVNDPVHIHKVLPHTHSYMPYLYEGIDGGGLQLTKIFCPCGDVKSV